MSSPRMTGNEKREARTLALQILFEVDLTEHALTDVLQRYLEDMALTDGIRSYVERLVQGFVRDQGEIDGDIAAAAPAFPVAQLPAVDRNILRVAIYELRSEPDVPIKAAINEAIELAKLFGGEKSGKFVNGVLGTVAKKYPRDGNGKRRGV
jgi:N utilization substance protein B